MEKKFDNLERPKESWWWRFDCPNFLTVALIILVLTLAIVFIKPDKPTEQAKISHEIDSLYKHQLNQIDSLERLREEFNNKILFEIEIYHNLQDSIAAKKAEWNRCREYKPINKIKP